MGRVEGKVALITGAARGQGRAHAVRLAEEGADVVLLDVCRSIDSVPYPLATGDDLKETEALVAATGRRVLSRIADVRDQAQLDAAVADAIGTFGHIDIVCANAGIVGFRPTWELSDAEWQDMLDVNLTGVFHTVRAVVPEMIRAGRGGSIVMTSSIQAMLGSANIGHYNASKSGVVGLMRTLATELDLWERSKDRNPMGIGWVAPEDMSNAVLFLASDEARFITGVALPVDAGVRL